MAIKIFDDIIREPIETVDPTPGSGRQPDPLPPQTGEQTPPEPDEPVIIIDTHPIGDNNEADEQIGDRKDQQAEKQPTKTEKNEKVRNAVILSKVSARASFSSLFNSFELQSDPVYNFFTDDEESTFSPDGDEKL